MEDKTAVYRLDRIDLCENYRNVVGGLGTHRHV